jgi:Tfp pilus assembly PilM family ATPase
MKTEPAGAAFGRAVIAVEVGSEWLKLVQTSSGRRGPYISGVHLHRLEGGDESLPAAVATAIKELKLPRLPVVACLPRQMVNIRFLDLPSTNPREIADMVDLQIGKQTPYSRDEIVFHYRPVGSAREGYARVMLVIVQRMMAQQRFHVLEEAGLRVEKMSVSSEGLLNWFRLSQAAAVTDGETVVLLDVDSNYTDLAVVAGGELAFSRSILIGAGQLLGEPGRWMEKLLGEIQHSLDTYRSELPGQKISRLCVTGAGPAVPDLSRRLEETFDFGVTNVDALAGAEMRKPVPALQDPAYRSVSITPLVGVALAPQALTLDLTPDAAKARKNLEEDAKRLTVLGIQVMLILMLLSLLVAGAYSRKSALLDDLRRVAQETGRTADSVVRMREKSRLVRDRLDPRRAPVAMLQELQRLLPETAHFTSIQMKENQIVVRGTAESVSDVLRFVNALEGSELFENVKSTSERRDFTITCAWEK